jgi:hypothetical protein
MKKLLFCCCLFGLLLTYYACVDRVVSPTEFGHNYYPLEVSKFLEYQVDSIIFDDAGNGNTTDTLRSFILEKVSEIETDGSGDTIFLIERRWRQNENDPWKLTHLFSAAISQFEGIRQEGNFRFQALSFPLSLGKRWEMTSYINPLIEVPIGSETLEVYNFWDSEVLEYDVNGEVGAFQFSDENLMTVSHASNDDDPLHFRVVTEKYVRNVGLVYKEMEILDSRCIRLGDPSLCIGQTWNEKAEKGFKLRQTLINYN